MDPTYKQRQPSTPYQRLLRYLIETSPEHWQTLCNYAEDTSFTLKIWRTLAAAELIVIVVGGAVWWLTLR